MTSRDAGGLSADCACCGIYRQSVWVGL